jgi:hypothetical protein
MEDGPWIRQSERPHRIQPHHQLVIDGPQTERSIDSKARPQLIRFEHGVGVGVDARPELGDPRRFHGQPRCLLVSAEPDEQVGASLERREHVEIRNAAAGSMCDVAIHGKHDRGPVIRVDEL